MNIDLFLIEIYYTYFSRLTNIERYNNWGNCHILNVIESFFEK